MRGARLATLKAQLELEEARARKRERAARAKVGRQQCARCASMQAQHIAGWVATGRCAACCLLPFTAGGRPLYPSSRPALPPLQAAKPAPADGADDLSNDLSNDVSSSGAGAGGAQAAGGGAGDAASDDTASDARAEALSAAAVDVRAANLKCSAAAVGLERVM